MHHLLKLFAYYLNEVVNLVNFLIMIFLKFLSLKINQVRINFHFIFQINFLFLNILKYY